MNTQSKTDKDIFEAFSILLETRYIDYAYADLFADALGISQKKLNDITRYFCKKTACQLVDKKIVSEAIVLLKGSKKTIGEIAWQLGYEDQYYFSRMFKRLTGNSPRQFRKEKEAAEK